MLTSWGIVASILGSFSALAIDWIPWSRHTHASVFFVQFQRNARQIDGVIRSLRIRDDAIVLTLRSIERWKRNDLISLFDNRIEEFRCAAKHLAVWSENSNGTDPSALSRPVSPERNKQRKKVEKNKKWINLHSMPINLASWSTQSNVFDTSIDSRVHTTRASCSEMPYFFSFALFYRLWNVFERYLEQWLHKWLINYYYFFVSPVFSTRFSITFHSSLCGLNASMLESRSRNKFAIYSKCVKLIL